MAQRTGCLPRGIRTFTIPDIEQHDYSPPYEDTSHTIEDDIPTKYAQALQADEMRRAQRLEGNIKEAKGARRK